MLVLNSTALALLPPENPDDAATWYVEINDHINRIASKRPSGDSILGLGEYVRKLGRRPGYPDLRWQNAYLHAQNELLSIPGHARHFSEELEKERELLGEKIVFSLKPQTYILETLPHLPSPETILVLGELLYDERDAAKVAYKDHTGMYGMRPNSVLAMEALERIGLRDPGIAKPQFIRQRYPEDGQTWTPDDQLQAEFEQRNLQRQENLRPWKEWIAQVKSGERAFSFKGQAVEYRFKPDGTWDTNPIANPPDDAPEIPEARSVDRRPAGQEAKEQPPGNAGKTFRSYLLAALATLLAFAAAWLGFRRMKLGV